PTLFRSRTGAPLARASGTPARGAGADRLPGRRLPGGEPSPRHPTGNGETAGFEGQGRASPRLRGGRSSMNDVEDAIDRIGRRFDPPPDGLARLTRRRHRVDTRRRIP